MWHWPSRAQYILPAYSRHAPNIEFVLVALHQSPHTVSTCDGHAVMAYIKPLPKFSTQQLS